MGCCVSRPYMGECECGNDAFETCTERVGWCSTCNEPVCDICLTRIPGAILTDEDGEAIGQDDDEILCVKHALARRRMQCRFWLIAIAVVLFAIMWAPNFKF